MIQRTFWLARFGSLVLLAFFVAVFAAGFVVNPWRQHLSLGDSLHLSVWNQGLDSRLVIFNDAEYGPYRGSIVGFVGNQFPRKRGFGDSWGVYYRHFEWPESTLWTIMVSVWYPIVALAIISGILFTRRNVRTTEETAK